MQGKYPVPERWCLFLKLDLRSKVTSFWQMAAEFAAME
jgi:hypothetical protein